MAAGNRKAKARPERASEDQEAHKQLQTKDSITNATNQLVMARNELCEIGSAVFVCIQALRGKGGDNVDVDPDVAAVLSAAYDKLVLDVDQNLRDALEALEVQP